MRLFNRMLVTAGSIPPLLCRRALRMSHGMALVAVISLLANRAGDAAQIERTNDAAGVSLQNQPPQPGGLKLLSVKRIWDEAPHNAFTSLIRFNGKWYCAFREARAHAVAGGPGRARVLVSQDGERWESAALLNNEGFDVRDPHLSVTPENELMLITGCAEIVNGVNKFHSATQFSRDGIHWTKPLPVGDPDFWLWSATWHKGICYSIGYNTSDGDKIRLYRSSDGRSFQTLVDDLGVRHQPSESAIVFDADDTARCLLRTGGPANFGESKSPYTDWNWVPTGEPVGGPALIHLPDGRWLAAGRQYSKKQRTALWWVDPQTARLTHALDLPSGGDASYPGLVWQDGVLSVSYYSSHEDQTSIYLAKVSIPDPEGSQPTLNQELAELKTNPDVLHFTATRERLAADPYRPLYHLSAPGGLLNDPNGFCQWQGKYHLFYQFFPTGSKVVVWAHAYSDDLVNWKDLPLAIKAGPETAIASGQTLVETNRVIAIYFGGGRGNSIAIASDPLLLHMEKSPDNPVIPIVKTDANGLPYRIFDPCIWKEEDGYYALSGVYKNGSRGKDAEMNEPLFRSRDLSKWEYLGPLISGAYWTEPGEDGAVPNFVPIGNGKHLLLFFSHKRAAQYLIGDYDRATHQFKPDYHGRMNYGPWVRGSLHAPSAFVDDTGRCLAIFNVRENKTDIQNIYKGRHPDAWYGIMTLPRHLWLDQQNALHMAPVREFESLRFAHQQAKPMTIPANQEVALNNIRGKAMELDAVFQPGKAREFGLNVLRSPDGQERTTITIYMNMYEPGRRQIGIDVSNASLRPDVQSRSPEIGPLTFADNQPVRLRVFIDRSIVEVFANDTQCLTLRMYPQREDSRGVSVFARGNDAQLLSLDAWQMHGVWPELKKFESQ